MIDLNKKTVKIDCSKCKRSITVSLKEIADEVLIECDCGDTIQLIDRDGTNKKAIEKINNALKDFQKV
jgi:peptide subunit release factor 1 (eRF1)